MAEGGKGTTPKVNPAASLSIQIEDRLLLSLKAQYPISEIPLPIVTEVKELLLKTLSMGLGRDFGVLFCLVKCLHIGLSIRSFFLPADSLFSGATPDQAAKPNYNF